MKGRLYLTDKRIVRGLIETRKQLLSVAKGMKAEDMRAAIEEIYAAAKIQRTPETREDMANLYTLDEQGIAHIDVVGLLTPTVDPCAAFFQEAETEYGFIQAAIREANKDFRVQGLQLEIDSPGGYANGVDETAQMIRASEKPLTARVHNMAASGAYWLASQAGRIIASSPADQIGSIGVVADEYDDDDWYANQGVIHRVYTSTDAPDKRPDTKTEEGRAKIVAMLDDLHQVFASRVAAGRHTTIEQVNANYGRGGLLIAADAREVGMIDEVIGVPEINQSGVAGEQTAAKASGIKQTGRGTMTPAELLKEHPECYAAIQEIGVQEERKRVEKLRAWAEADSACAQVVAEAIASGRSVDDVMPQIHAAIRKAANAEKPTGDDNPPPVTTATATTGSGEQGNDEEAVRKQAKALVASLPKD